jgi:hypothetical protein
LDEHNNTKCNHRQEIPTKRDSRQIEGISDGIRTVRHPHDEITRGSPLEKSNIHLEDVIIEAFLNLSDDTGAYLGDAELQKICKDPFDEKKAADKQGKIENRVGLTSGQGRIDEILHNPGAERRTSGNNDHEDSNNGITPRVRAPVLP